MPSTPKPKQFVAVRNFKHGNKVYRKGDPVTVRRTIDLLSRRGDKWITRAPAKPVSTEPDPLTEEAASDGS